VKGPQKYDWLGEKGEDGPQEQEVLYSTVIQKKREVDELISQLRAKLLLKLLLVDLSHVSSQVPESLNSSNVELSSLRQ
jgi:hypothetical protein